LGLYLLRQKAYEHAGEAFEKACTLGNGKGCFEQGRLYTEGKGFRRSNLNARIFFKQGCYLDHPFSCSSLGFLYEQGEYRAEPAIPNYGKARHYYKKACDLENGGGCALLGSLLEKGTGAEQNVTGSQQLYQKACDLGVQYGCKHLAPLGINPAP
jgi:TPR repeat protein